MRPTKLLNLLALNAQRGAFRAEANTIYLYDVIVGSDAEAEFWGGVSPEAFAKQIAGMTGDVALRINSPGGDVFAGVAIAQAIRAYAGKVTAHVDGLAASAASAVAVACDAVIMAPGSMMMIHNAWTLGFGNRHDFTDLAVLLEKIDGDLAAAYAKRGALDAAAFAAMMDKETWLTADETVQAGLADSIAPEKSAQALATFDLSAFASAPKDDTTVTVTVTVEIEEEPDPADPNEPGETAEAANAAADRTRRLAARLLAPAA